MTTVYKAGTKDLDDFYPFFVKTIKEYFPYYSGNITNYFLKDVYSLKAIQADLKKKARWLYLAKNNDQIVGYLLALKPEGGVAYCQWVAVDKNFRNQHIATKMIDFWQKDALADGAHKLYLTTVEGTEFYTKIGFTVMGTMPKAYYGTDTTDLYKSIAEPDEKKFLHLE